MDRSTLLRLIPFLPEDATEISIKGHDSNEVFFNTHQDYSKIALPAQRGTYVGDKRRWRMSEETLHRPKAVKPLPLPVTPPPPGTPPPPRPVLPEGESAHGVVRIPVGDLPLEDA